MKIRIAISVLFLFLSIPDFGQKNQDPLKKFKVKADSITQVFAQKSHSHLEKVDSINNVFYIQHLESISNLQNNRDTYYGTVFAALSVAFTLIAIILAVNWAGMLSQNKKAYTEYSVSMERQRGEYESQISKLRGEHETQIANLRETFQSTVKEQHAEFDKLTKENVKLQTQNQAAISSMLQKLENRLQEKTDEGSQHEIAEMKKEIENLRAVVKEPSGGSVKPNISTDGLQIEFLDTSPITGTHLEIICVSCQNRMFVKRIHWFMAPYDQKAIVTCPRCGTMNEIPRSLLH
jgi:hypothetical protein